MEASKTCLESGSELDKKRELQFTIRSTQRAQVQAALPRAGPIVTDSEIVREEALRILAQQQRDEIPLSRISTIDHCSSSGASHRVNNQFTLLHSGLVVLDQWPQLAWAEWVHSWTHQIAITQRRCILPPQALMSDGQLHRILRTSRVLDTLAVIMHCVLQHIKARYCFEKRVNKQTSQRRYRPLL